MCAAPQGVSAVTGTTAAEEGASGPAPSELASTILVVDDNERTTRALAKLLNGAGYRTRVCYTGEDALAASEQEGTPAAAMVDIHLPDISGLVLTSKLRERLGAGFPIVVVSGDTSMETIRTLPHVGATYFFPKPVNAEYLLERLREWVG